jgi:hypothetical protein
VTITGRFRVYFNRHGAAPLVWCVAPVPGDPQARTAAVLAAAQIGAITADDARQRMAAPGPEPCFEIAVRDIVFDGVRVTTTFRAKPTPDDEDGRPSAWLEADGVLTIGDNGVAVIERAA